MGKKKEKTRPEEKSFYETLKDKYNDVIAQHGDFKSIVWDGSKKEFVVTL